MPDRSALCRLLALLCLGVSPPALAAATGDVLELSLEELVNLDVTIATLTLSGHNLFDAEAEDPVRTAPPIAAFGLSDMPQGQRRVVLEVSKRW